MFIPRGWSTKNQITNSTSNRALSTSLLLTLTMMNCFGCAVGVGQTQSSGSSMKEGGHVQSVAYVTLLIVTLSLALYLLNKVSTYLLCHLGLLPYLTRVKTPVTPWTSHPSQPSCWTTTHSHPSPPPNEEGDTPCGSQRAPDSSLRHQSTAPSFTTTKEWLSFCTAIPQFLSLISREYGASCKLANTAPLDISLDRL